jgi:uncharacterized protein YdeI (YjbR/CyaY-like superfamily)
VTPTFFRTQAQFRSWLRKHHRTETELWVGFYKKGCGKPSITYPESVDEALCWGWIDGIRKSRDAESYVQRFTPRRKGSIWSAVNVEKIRVLTAANRMQPAGRKAWEERDPKKVQRYSFEQRDRVALSPADRRALRAKPKAWAFFEALPPGYKRTVTWWVTSAKRQETRAKRLATLIEASAAGRRL